MVSTNERPSKERIKTCGEEARFEQDAIDELTDLQANIGEHLNRFQTVLENVENSGFAEEYPALFKKMKDLKGDFAFKNLTDNEQEAWENIQSLKGDILGTMLDTYRTCLFEGEEEKPE